MGYFDGKGPVTEEERGTEEEKGEGERWRGRGRGREEKGDESLFPISNQ